MGLKTYDDVDDLHEYDRLLFFILYHSIEIGDKMNVCIAKVEVEWSQHRIKRRNAFKKKVLYTKMIGGKGKDKSEARKKRMKCFE